MIKYSLLTAISIYNLSQTGQARLGDTLEQYEQRNGKSVYSQGFHTTWKDGVTIYAFIREGTVEYLKYDFKLLSELERYKLKESILTSYDSRWVKGGLLSHHIETSREHYITSVNWGNKLEIYNQKHFQYKFSNYTEAYEREYEEPQLEQPATTTPRKSNQKHQSSITSNIGKSNYTGYIQSNKTTKDDLTRYLQQRRARLHKLTSK